VSDAKDETTRMNSLTAPRTVARTHFLLTCLLNAGRAQEAERLITQQVPKEQTDELRYYLGLAYAQQGRLDDAVRVFMQILHQNSTNITVQRAALPLLHRLAVQKINARDWAGAGVVLGDLMRFYPNNPDIKSLVLRVENVLPIVYLKANRRNEAAEEWEKARGGQPGKGALAHSLALLYFYQALDAEKRSPARPSEAEPLWRKAIGNWVMLACNEGFWQEWMAERRKVYPIPDEVAAELRLAWGDELTKRFNQYADDCEQAGKTAEAKRYQNLALLYWVEQTTAYALSELRQALCPHCQRLTSAMMGADGKPVCMLAGCRQVVTTWQPSHKLPICGPLMLEHFNLQAQAAELAVNAEALPNGGGLTGPLSDLKMPIARNNAMVLRRCLSPRSAVFALLARHRYHDALEALGDNPAASGIVTGRISTPVPPRLRGAG
jgi:tetratricopeptide (TPR) repeat protein